MFETEVGKAVFDALKSGLDAGADEPMYVKRLVHALPKAINSQLAQYNDTRFGRFYCQGYFTHQFPYVKMVTATRRCEAGDLLIVVNDLANNHYNAVLLQAKMVKWREIVEPENSDTEGDIVQFELYSKWPKFDMPSFSGSFYNIATRGPHAGAQYLFIDEDSIKNFQTSAFVSSTKSQMISHDICFEIFMWNVLGFQNHAGKRICSRKEVSKDDWSRFVWDMVEMIIDYDEARSIGGNQSRNYPRVAQTGLVSFLRKKPLVYNPQDAHGAETRFDDGGGSMGLLMFTREGVEK